MGCVGGGQFVFCAKVCSVRNCALLKMVQTTIAIELTLRCYRQRLERVACNKSNSFLEVLMSCFDIDISCNYSHSKLKGNDPTVLNIELLFSIATDLNYLLKIAIQLRLT